MGLKIEGFLVAIFCLGFTLNAFLSSNPNIKKRTDIDEALKKKKLSTVTVFGLCNIIVATFAIVFVLFFLE
jgi:hypothetical protein